MNEAAAIIVGEELLLPRAELDFRASRSGGPGGQHVNTTSSKVELTWSVTGSPSLSEAQRERICDKLANRIDGDGVLHLTASEHRSQHQNRDAVVERFAGLLRAALHVPKTRKKTRPTRASREQRLQAKRRRAEVKRLRGGISSDE
ncbi:MAG: aminoacyl-tRNA hydrolase [Gemmatimonadota bacterium]|nr:aminoacyl-tRNA hydrolase [Gemmatimonadota bacterium]